MPKLFNVNVSNEVAGGSDRELFQDKIPVF
jgi:hypothetical protein